MGCRFSGDLDLKKNIPDSEILIGHQDFELLNALSDEIVRRAGGKDALVLKFPALLRQCVDDVIMTPKTGRRSYDELEKTEKTYIGTRVEIELRAMLELPKGEKLDVEILGHEVDIKNTMGGNWMIPTEAVGYTCILVAADEKRGVCYLGLLVARLEYLSAGQNKDSKKSVSAAGFAHILWLLKEQPYPPNFWRTISVEATERIFAERSGNRRMMALFREVQRRPIGRDVVAAVAQQPDFMRRIRADSGKGTRDHLAREGIALLPGSYDANLIAALGLPSCSASEFISCKPETRSEVDIIADAGIELG